jgi:LysM repeat protein
LAREQKLALIVGFSITLLVGILLTDHLSRARTLRLEGISEHEGPALVNVTQRSALSPRDARGSNPAQSQPARGPEERDSAPEPLSRPGPRGEVADEREIGRSLGLADPVAEAEPPVLVMGETQLDDLVDDLGGEVSTPDAERRVDGPAPIADPLEPAPTPEWYTVRKNESLYVLCERFYGNGMLYPKLIAHNTERVGPEGQIREGIRIQIPHPSVIVGPGADFRQSPSAKATPPKEKSDEPAKVETRRYRVAKGDCLSMIAQRELGTIRRQKDILALNDLKSPDDVRQGMILLLPVN